MIQNRSPAKPEFVLEPPQDGSARIVVKVKAKEVELASFGSMLLSIASDYQKFVNSKHPKDAGTCILLVQDIRAGSVVLELVQAFAPLFPAGESIQLAIGFIQFYEKNLLPYLHIGGRSENTDSTSLRNFRSMFRAIAKDLDGEQTIEAVHCETNGERTVMESFKITGSQASTGQREMLQHIKELSFVHQPKLVYERVLMQFKRSDLGDVYPGKLSGERVIVESISDKDLPLIYETEQAVTEIKGEIRKFDGNVFKKVFMVDLCVDTKNDKPYAYRVIKAHQIVDLLNE